ncbi:MAG: DUF6493 family protein [Labilithrix sp.]
MSLDEDLQTAIRGGDARQCVVLLEGKSEKERSALAGSMLETFTLAHALLFSRDSSKAVKRLGVSDDDGASKRLVLDAARVALLGTITNVDTIKKFAWRSVPSSDDLVLAALKGRPPELVKAWVSQICELTQSRWPVMRRLVKEGFCVRPDTDGYVLAMIHEAGCRASRRFAHLTPLFEEDPELLDDDVWRVFEVEGNRDCSLTGFERAWQGFLVDLQARGRLDRARMLDATLAALARDFAQHKAGFYSRLHEALKPTPEEMAARASTYVELLGSRISPTVSLATRVVESLPEDVEMDTASFARAAVSAARSARGQSTALALLRLLHPRRDDAHVLDATAAFLEHTAVDVIDAALATLEASKPSPALVARVAKLVASMPASRRARATAWVEAAGGKSAAVAPAATEVARAAPRVTKDASPDEKRAGVAALAAAPPEGPWPRVTLDDRANPAPRLDPERRVVPIADLDELFAAVARSMEEPNDRVTYERVLDGVSRLGAPLDALPKDATKPLAARADKLASRHGHAAALVRGWLAHEGDLSTKFVNTTQFGVRRIQNVLTRLERGETRPLLSMPSTETFFVDPLVLAERVKAEARKKSALDVADAVTAMLRLAPERRKEALKKLRGVEGPLAAAVRHALGSDDERVDAKQPALWFAAARARGGDDAAVMKAFPEAGADAGAAARIAFRWKRVTSRDNKENTWGRLEVDFEPAPASLEAVPRDAFSVMLASDGHGGHGAQFGSEADLRQIGSIYPLDRRTFLAHGVDRIAGNVDWSSASWENHVFIEALVDPDVPLDDTSIMLLAIATNTKEAREKALGIDALVAAISDGRVVGPELGRAMAFFWDPIHDDVRWSRRPTAGRWASTLGTVAMVSALHAEIVRRVLESFFATPPAAPPADLVTLLQLWLDLAVDARAGVPAGPARDALATYTGKAKKIAKQLLELQGTRSVKAGEAHAAALEARRARAARYISRRTGWSATSG